MSKTVIIKVGSDTLKTLKGSCYRFSCAVSVGGSFGHVWFQEDQFLAKNKFSVENVFEIFARTGSRNGSETNHVRIAKGQIATLDNVGKISAPSPNPVKNLIGLKNELDNPVFVGLSAKYRGFNNKQAFSTCYLSRSPIVKGTDQLNPQNQLLLWFGQGHNIPLVSTELIATTTSIKVDLTNRSSATVTYTNNGDWTEE